MTDNTTHRTPAKPGTRPLPIKRSTITLTGTPLTVERLRRLADDRLQGMSTTVRELILDTPLPPETYPSYAKGEFYDMNGNRVYSSREMVNIPVRMTREEYAAVKDVADSRDQSISMLTRQVILAAYYERFGVDTGEVPDEVDGEDSAVDTAENTAGDADEDADEDGGENAVEE